MPPSSPTQPLLGGTRPTYSATPEPTLSTDPSDSVAAATHKKGTSIETFFHIVCITAGTGILQLPYALKEGGWIGALYIVLAGMISSYTGNMLIRCLYCKQGTRLQSYSDVVEAALGRRGKQIVRALKDFNLLGVVGIYIVLAGVNISALLANSTAGVQNVQLWIAAAAMLVWLVVVLAREIHDVFILSVFGTLTTVVTVVIIVWVGICDAARQKEMPPTKLVDAKMLPISLASICFSFGGNLNWPDLEASMESPKLWSRTLSVATAFIAFIYLCVAVIGYGTYGDHVMSPILLSLPQGLSVVTANVMITAHVLLACPILLTAVFIEAERDLGIGAAHHSPYAERIYRALFRTVMMAAVALCALFVSDFAKFVPILGAVAASMVVFVIPVVCYIILYREQRTFTLWEYAWCALIVCVGLMCLVIGTSEAIGNL
ncbi:hypothetical protein FBU59_001317 [Linderina macrospora]|uniref:Uncharacterized protein n=1 Tax=Linderina macrospora TaxID=4868 RepID=A0ACC1JEL7_9FUNG|nr:hypothetical protein FBU59_001317 [Linderina macrospora]